MCICSPSAVEGGRWKHVDLDLELTGQPVYPNRKASGLERDDVYKNKIESD